MNTSRRYALTDNQWEWIKDLLLGREGSVGVAAKDNRLFVDAVLYRYRTGIPWRDLPARFSDFRVGICVGAEANVGWIDKPNIFASTQIICKTDNFQAILKPFSCTQRQPEFLTIFLI